MNGKYVQHYIDYGKVQDYLDALKPAIRSKIKRENLRQQGGTTEFILNRLCLSFEDALGWMFDPADSIDGQPTWDAIFKQCDKENKQLGVANERQI